LDAPVVAVLWQGFLACRFSLPLRPAAQLVLGLTVWSIYLLDRLLDARKPPAPNEPVRHRYYRRHWKTMAALLAVVLSADVLIATFALRAPVLREGLVPLAGVAIYLAAFHTPGQSMLFPRRVPRLVPRRVPKEVAAAFLFTAGTFLVAWAALPCSGLAWAALSFFVLCLANIVAIEAWEWRELSNRPPHSDPHPALHPDPHAALHPDPHQLTRWLARNYLLWVPVAAILCAVAGRNPWYASIAMSGAACALLFWIGRRISLDARRALVDGVLLSPLLFLLLR
jgi:hypothetical protein